jgi:hypothetical protein
MQVPWLFFLYSSEFYVSFQSSPFVLSAFDLGGIFLLTSSEK